MSALQCVFLKKKKNTFNMHANFCSVMEMQSDVLIILFFNFQNFDLNILNHCHVPTQPLFLCSFQTMSY